MARLSGSSDRGPDRGRAWGSDQRQEHGQGTDRRGQMILITGFALAVAFVTLALVVNSVVFTGNLATSSESAAASDAITYQADVSAGAERVLAFINEHNTSSYSELEDNLEADMDNVSDLLLRHRVTEGQVVDSRVDTTFRGTWIRQTNSSRNFTNVDGFTEWVLVDNADGARSFRIQVTNGTRLDLSSDDPFTVIARHGSSDWRLNVSEDAVTGNATVFVRRADGSEIECNAPVLSDFWINVSEGTIDGSECEGLAFGGQLGAIQRIEYSNAHNVEGTYRLMANKSEGNVDSSDYSTTGSPFTEPAIYGLRLNITYESNRVEHDSDRRVVPGETE